MHLTESPNREVKVEIEVEVELTKRYPVMVALDVAYSLATAEAGLSPAKIIGPRWLTVAGHPSIFLLVEHV